MTDWTAGYVADIGYTYGYYTELNPLRLRLPFLNAGVICPNVGTACELGFGQGLSVGIHAAASLTKWYGTDFNPAQAGFAQEIASVSGANAHLFDQAFAEFCARPDLPDFDYIGLHGIWSWISDDNRAAIVDFLHRKLKVGGVLYISYNTQPGWAAMLPMRELLTDHADVLGSCGQGIVSRIDSALDFADRMLATHPAYARANPQVAERIKKMKGQNRNYLAHEYFNRDWHPMSFARMADWLAPAKLNFVCSAHYLDHVDSVNLADDQLAFLKEIPDSMFRETVRDFMCNTQFRRDYWVRGARQLDVFTRGQLLRAERVILLINRDAVELKVNGSRGEASLNDNVYNPILDLLSDHKARTLEQIERAVENKNIVFAQVLQAVMILIGKGDIALAQEESVVSRAKRFTDKLNLHLMNKCRGSNDLANLASPVTGGGLTVNRFQQLFLLARSLGKKTPEEWAQFVWQHLAILNQRITKEGVAIESVEDNMAELVRHATEFDRKNVPILKALQVV
ncbi:class I SAM-dependent methyltransferase [Candidatus Accumulibacter vicinus]|uniref:Putative methyltransferase regulatory domain protein n=1 Tax=Candidatus Accumulibacter vicinus TaxID=2954382 RepID=A0A084XXF6_9PROT|nr:class I SAM-dependent methyltransferase [Candidatus Accumulibacter vicinus]KFB67150.1 MAG: putative methyltransferase regulatory domain protein [Candidatus Accumulibacter vicinus]